MAIPRKTRVLIWEGDLPELGDYLRTDRGSVYMVLNFKPNTRQNPKSVGSMNILKLSPDEIEEIPEDAKTHGFKWIKG